MEGEGSLFEDIVFSVIPSRDITDTSRDAVIHAVTNHGGRFVPLRDADQQLPDLNDLTHVISTHIDFPQFSEALRRGVSVVTPAWVTNSLGKRRLSPPRQYSPDPTQFFRHVVVTLGNVPAGDGEAIIAGVVALGGQYSGSLTKLVTHIVTNDMNHDKCHMVEEKGLKCHVLLPHWFDDCLKLGKKINEEPYLFPNPALLRPRDDSAVRPGLTPQLEGATTPEPKGEPMATPPMSPSELRRNLNAFLSKKIFLCDDLQIGRHLYSTIKELIHKAGGQLTEDYEVCDIFIGFYRDGDGYMSASRGGKCVANLAWLFHVVNQNKYTNPLSKLLHYPVPRDPLPGFGNMKISISNYAGDARVYVENLIRHSGATFTKTMKQDNTHLITAHNRSEKCEAAQEWNINIINHLWLEESYAKCAAQSLANPKYTHFPARTNLGEVAGQTMLDMKSVERLYFPKPKKSPQKAAQSSPKPFSPRKAVPAVAPLTTSEQGDEADSSLSLENGNDEMDIDSEREAPHTTVKTHRGRPKKTVSTPGRPQAEKENESPIRLSTGRASKIKAASSLRAQAQDMTQFQKEMKRKGGVVHGASRATPTEDTSSPAPTRKTSKKRPSDEYEVIAQGSDLSDGETQAASAQQSKKSKLGPSALPPIRYRMMVTGDTRWINNANQESSDKATLRRLGVALVHEPKDVNILVAPKILRTKKFLTALSWAPKVVGLDFLDTALGQNELIEHPSVLVDHDTEQLFGFTLAESLERAKRNQRKLFRGWTVFVSKDVAGGFDTYKDILSCNGGSAMLYQGRTGINMPTRQREDAEVGPEAENQGQEDNHNYIYLVSGTTDVEVKTWKKFRDTAEKQGLKARIARTDWLLQAAMSQQIEWNVKWALDE